MSARSDRTRSRAAVSASAVRGSARRPACTLYAARLDLPDEHDAVGAVEVRRVQGEIPLVGGRIGPHYHFPVTQRRSHLIGGVEAGRPGGEDTLQRVGRRCAEPVRGGGVQRVLDRDPALASVSAFQGPFFAWTCGRRLLDRLRLMKVLFV